MKREAEAIRNAFKAGTIEYLPASKARKYRAWAKAQAKDTLISLRINGRDLTALKARAAKKGKKYQTFIGEILHREAAKAA